MSDAPPVPAALPPFPDDRRRLFQILNSSTAPVWLAMIVAPRSRITARLVSWSTPLMAALGVTYTGLLAAGIVRGGERVDFRDPDSIRAGLTSPDAFLAGWTHYLAFDLFVGRWILDDANARGTSARLPLLLTWMAGPAGLTLHLARRRRHPLPT